MSHIDVSSSAEKPNPMAGLYLAEPVSDRLLLLIETNTANDRDAATFAKTMAPEGWNVLHLTCAATAEAAAAEITEALARASLRLALPSTKPLRIMAIAEGAAVHAACIAVLQSHRQTALPDIGGLVVVDAFASASVSAAIADQLTDIDGLATVIAARRSSSEARRNGLSVHQRRQSNGKETHYLVLAENDGPLLAQIADAQGALGREISWLLDPVHSRNGA